ncbi:SWPV1-010 [Shearwaterpox virus]|uniref:SWPV1-010 n=1 Tax=Shearwaterpox virus TaxID=1974596 RepID=A0A1V0S7T3_CNPV|nr:SWPV1-010 [Shearwaterpox virus]
MASIDWRIGIYSRDINHIENITKTKKNLLNVSVEEIVTPLIDAVRSCDVRTVQLLIDQGVSINHINPKVPNPLLVAIKIRSPEIINILINNGVDTSVLPISGISSNILTTILDCGINVNIKDNEQKTFLYHAVKSGDLESVITLIRHRANTYIADEDGNYPIHIAIQNNFFDIIKILIDNSYAKVYNSYGETPIHYAVKYGDYKTVKLLIEDRCYTLKKCNRGLTPLHTAILHNRLVIPLLINEVTINSQDINGRTPLDYAVEYPCDRDIVCNLLYHGADISIIDKDGRNIIDRIIPYYDKKAIVKDIIANGILKKEIDNSNTYDILSNTNIMDNKEFLDFGEQCKSEIKEMRKYNIDESITMLDMCKKINIVKNNELNNREKLIKLLLKSYEFPIYSMYLVNRIREHIKNV